MLSSSSSCSDYEDKILRAKYHSKIMFNSTDYSRLLSSCIGGFGLGICDLRIMGISFGIYAISSGFQLSKGYFVDKNYLGVGAVRDFIFCLSSCVASLEIIGSKSVNNMRLDGFLLLESGLLATTIISHKSSRKNFSGIEEKLL